MASNLSVCICTYNRANLLTRTLKAVLAQTRLPGEIVVIDNGSTDATRQVVDDLAVECLTPIRYVYEEKPGIAHARNRAIQEAKGEYLAFVDDDAWPETYWLEELLRAVETQEPSPVCVVGKVTLDWDGGRPTWMPHFVEPLLCAYDQGPIARVLNENEYLLTTNVLFHRKTVIDLGRFRTYLGRKRGQMLGGEDNDIHQRLIRHGSMIFYQPTAIVHHDVDQERQTRIFIIKRMFWDGATQPLMAFSQAEEQALPYSAVQHVYVDFKRILRLSLALINPLNGDPFFDRLLSFIQRLGRFRSNFLLVLGRI